MQKSGPSWQFIAVTVAQLISALSLIPLSLWLYPILNEIVNYMNFV